MSCLITQGCFSCVFGTCCIQALTFVGQMLYHWSTFTVWDLDLVARNVTSSRSSQIWPPRLDSEHLRDDLQLMATLVSGNLILYSVLCAHCMNAGKYPWIYNNMKGGWMERKRILWQKGCEYFCRHKKVSCDIYFPQQGECLILFILQTSLWLVMSYGRSALNIPIEIEPKGEHVLFHKSKSKIGVCTQLLQG